MSTPKTTNLLVGEAVKQEGLTKEFIGKILKRALEESGNEVVSVEVTVLGGGGNTGAVVSKVSIHYKNDNTGAGSLPSSLIFKYADTKFQKNSPTHRPSMIERAILTNAGYRDSHMLELEYNLYKSAVEIFYNPVHVETPKVYYLGMSGASTTLSRLMFTLFQRFENVQGSVIMEDCSSGVIGDAVGDIAEESIKRMLVAAGALHGYSAKVLGEKKKSKELRQLRIDSSFNYNLSSLSIGLSRMVKRNGVKKGIAKIVRNRWGPTDLKLLEEDSEIFAAFQAFEKVYSSKILGYWERRYPFKCVVHGDLHAGNVFFMPDGSMKLFDFQMWGFAPAPWEICYFFSSNVPYVSRENDLSLLRVYHAELEKHAKYPFDWFVRDFELATLDMLAAYMFRRGRVETPKSVAKAIKKKGKFEIDIQRLCTEREKRLFQRLKGIFKENPNFDYDMNNKV